MQIVYALERPVNKPPLGLFLAGPSPRGDGEYDWRPEALEILESMEFQGTVFVPLPRDGVYKTDYDHKAQIDWELDCLEASCGVAFWIPRDLVYLPGFTTNVEYGLFARSGKVVLGYPKTASKMKYLQRVATRFSIPTFKTLQETLAATVHIAMQPKSGDPSLELLENFKW